VSEGLLGDADGNLLMMKSEEGNHDVVSFVERMGNVTWPEMGTMT